MKTYARYKDSGISWIGKIPEHWDKRKFLYLFKERSEKNHPNEVMLCATQSRGVIPQSMYENRVVVVNTGFEGLKLVKKGDFVISLRSFQGGIEYAYYQGIISAAYTILYISSDCLSSDYIRILFKSSPFIGLLKLCVTGIREGQNINNDLLRKQFLPIPPIEEQKAIAVYLDNKTKQINELVVAKQKQIELLKEYKQSLIANAVTKGINSKVKMKDSGIRWIGKVPEHWEKRKFQYLFKERSEKNHPNEPILCATQSHGVIPQSMYENRVVVVNTGFEGLKLVKKGDFVISLRSFQGGIEYAHYQGIISAAYTILYINTDCLDSDYIRILFKSFPFINMLKICVTGIREGQNINNDLLKKQFIPVPPIDEQKQIVAYINERVSSIDPQISSIEKQIANLNEYKQSLISDVVTGKVKV